MENEKSLNGNVRAEKLTCGHFNESQSREIRLWGRNFNKIKARQTERTERQTVPHPHHFSGPITPGFKISFRYLS